MPQPGATENVENGALAVKAVQASRAGLRANDSLPRCDGAIRGIGEKFTANLGNGTGSVPCLDLAGGMRWQSVDPL